MHRLVCSQRDLDSHPSSTTYYVRKAGQVLATFKLQSSSVKWRDIYVIYKYGLKEMIYWTCLA